MTNPSTLNQLVGLVSFGAMSYGMHCGFRWIQARAEKAWETGHPTLTHRVFRSAGRFLEWMGYIR